MSFALTYGSFGDLITTVQLVRRLIQALSESHGSARELQTFIFELRQFQTVLQELISFWESKKQCLEFQQLTNIASPVIHNCKRDIEDFLERVVKRYGNTLLRQRSSRKTLWDVVKAIQWNLCEAEGVEQLRDQLRSSMAILQMVQSRAHRISDDQDHNNLSGKVMLLMDAERQADSIIDARFAEVMTSLRNETAAISRIENLLATIVSAVSSMSNNVLAIRDTVISLEQAVLMLPGMMSRLTIYGHNIAYIEDALGWSIPILMDTYPSWETVHSIILDQFARHGSPGLDKIKAKHYFLQDSVSGTDANFTLPFYQSVCPGQTYHMSIAYHSGYNTGDMKSKWDQQNVCPKCRHVNEVADPDNDVTCSNRSCRFIYRRVLDVSHLDEENLQKLARESHNRQLTPHNNTEGEMDDYVDEGENIGNKVSEIEIAGQSSPPSSKNILDIIAIFKRVRLLSTWEACMDSRGPLVARAGDICIWNTSVDFMLGPEVQMDVSVHLHQKPYLNWVTDGRRPSKIEEYPFRTFIGFIGRTLEQSSPVFLIVSDSRRIRKRLLQVMKRLDWLGKQSRFSFATGPSHAFVGYEEYSRAERRSRCIPGTDDFTFVQNIKTRMRSLSA